MVKRSLFLVLIVLLLVSAAWAELVTANFIVPFNNATRETALPKDKDGQRAQIDLAALTLEKNGTIVVQVRAEKAVIDAMKKDPKNLWLLNKTAIAITEIEKVKVDKVTLELSPDAARAFMTKSKPLAEILKQDWTTSDKAILSAVKLHEGNEAGYKHGLGERTVVVAK